jgi:ribose 5-phosphate isomerase B
MKLGKIYLGSDHGGFKLKESIIGYLKGGELMGRYEIEDLGCYEADLEAKFSGRKQIDYPEYAHRVAHEVRAMSDSMGILVCGTGLGMSMAANRTKGVRAAVCHDEYTARMAREHNYANVLCLGERVVDMETGLRIVGIFLETDFSKERRHTRRVLMIDPDWKNQVSSED